MSIAQRPLECHADCAKRAAGQPNSIKTQVNFAAAGRSPFQPTAIGFQAQPGLQAKLGKEGAGQLYAAGKRKIAFFRPAPPGWVQRPPMQFEPARRGAFGIGHG